MDKFMENVRQKLLNYPSGRHFVFPTAASITKDSTEETDWIVNSVKNIVTSLTTLAQMEETTTESTVPTTIFEVMQDVNSTMLQETNNPNLTMATTSNSILEILNNNSSILEVINNDNSTVFQTDNDDNSTNEITSLFFNSTEKSSVFDWMSDETNHNLTMVHGGPEKETADQTVFIILGVILGMLVAISFVLLLIYISYKRSNLYTLQEQASSQSRHAISLQASSSEREERDPEVGNENDKSGYRF